MSLNKEIEELDKLRIEDGDKSRAHYAKLNLPGDRKKGVNADDVRARIAAMKAERDKAKK